MVGGLQGEEWKFIQKYLKEKLSCGVGKTEEISHHAWAAMRIFKVLCEFRISLEQLSFEGHIFLISAPNRTRFKALDS